MTVEVKEKSKTETIEVMLKEAKNLITKAIDLSFSEINENPGRERDYVLLFGQYMTEMNNYYLKEAERTGNDSVGKNMIKYLMFKRF